MKRILQQLFLCALFSGIFISSALAGPFGIEMGMSLEEVEKACKTAHVHLEGDIYEITPPKTNNRFQTYSVRIDQDYGVYWLKAVGKRIKTNSYGNELKLEFNQLVESIRKTYGKESIQIDSLQRGSIWNSPQDFMLALESGERELYALWSLELESIIDEIIDFTQSSEHLLKDTILQNLIKDKNSKISKLPNNVRTIGIFANALSSSIGYITLEYEFLNMLEVEEKADSVF